MASPENFLSTHEVAISTLSPVHIGCGEDYEPTNYLIKDKFFYHFQAEKLLEKFHANIEKYSSAIKELNNALDSDQTLLEVQKFFSSKYDLIKTIASKKAEVSAGVDSFYREKIGKIVNEEAGGKKVINNLGIERTYFNLFDSKPIIPGSGLKGAIRTAMLHSLYDKRNLDKNAKSLLEGNIIDESLYFLKVGDTKFIGGKSKQRNAQGIIVSKELPPTKFIFALRKYKNKDKDGVSQLVEAIPAGGNNIFTGNISLSHTRNTGLFNQWGLKKIAEACNKFYLPLLQKDLNDKKICSEWRKTIKQEWLNRIEKNDLGEIGFIVRVGGFCGKESLIPYKEDDFTQATTYWLSADSEKEKNNLIPFGWVFVQLK